jgi:hypothetical protein
VLAHKDVFTDRVDILHLHGIANICCGARTDRLGQFDSAGSRTIDRERHPMTKHGDSGGPFLPD